MSDLVSLEKTAPIILLENRRAHLIQWTKDGDRDIAEAEELIRSRKQRAIEIADELIQIETALNALHAAHDKELNNGGE